PSGERQIDPALEDQVLEQQADLVANDRGDQRRPLAEAAPQPAGHVVLAAALPDPELTGGANPALTRIEAQHDLAQRKNVERAGFLRPELEAGQSRRLRHLRSLSSPHYSSRRVESRTMRSGSSRTPTRASSCRPSSAAMSLLA